MDYTVIDHQGDRFSVRNIYCIGRNYRTHAAELNHEVPGQPFFFQKSIPALNTAKEIILPIDREIHHELEIVVLIGKNGENISENDADDFIHGYALGLDLTDRKLQTKLKESKLPWLLAKSFKGSAVVSTFQSENITDDFWLRINGEIRQRGNGSQMIFSIPQQISFLSRMIPLMKGDLIFTGTPSGVGYIQPGDLLKLGVGEQPIHFLSVR
ncbi:MAG: fumarylacetoacetate hydrolase family protein [Candidatus Marinimicrobia bacterium]|nr:fumarylacetoacetate hydrolase family protein [Candidatus Neomarinimicrobiota bacterium]MBL7011030.1 fumarylacetoacetate hydrolase family protein [Candidatus Neomarinimicrobiota bacterium]MBL7029966.1 fumarylacetoacetate hydrolase family protein [Candidatus Neomarinimicrobiota bacterium]